LVVWLVVCGFRSLNVGGLDSGGLDSGGRKEMESYLLGRSPRTKPHQAAGEEEWKATSSGEALEQSQFKLQAKGNGIQVVAFKMNKILGIPLKGDAES